MLSLKTRPSPRFVCEHDSKIRRSFLRTVLLIFALQLLMIRGCVWWATQDLFLSEQELDAALHPYVLVIAATIALVLFLVMWCFASLARTFPVNIILLGLFTLSLAYLLAALASYYNTLIVVQCLDLLLLQMIVLLFYVWLPCCTGGVSFLLTGLGFIGLLVLVSLFWMVPRWEEFRQWNWTWTDKDELWRTQQRATEAVGISISLFMALILSLYVLYDLHFLCQCLGPEDAIQAAFRLSCDTAGILAILVQSLGTCSCAQNLCKWWKSKRPI